MSHIEKNLSFKLGSLVLSVYVPSLLISIGIGIVVPIFPLLSQDLGASIALTGVVVAMRSVGTAVFDIPAGILLDHLKKRHTMVIAVSGISLFAGIISFSSSIAALAVFSFLMGGLESIYTISRLSYIKEMVPTEKRGQALSMMGGLMRVGRFVGPIIGGVVGNTYGLHATFLAQALVTLFAFLFVFGFLKPVGDGRADGEKTADSNHPLHRRLKNTIVLHRRSFYTTGLSMVALGILRSGREIMIPLWGKIIGLDVAEIGLIVGLSSAIDMTLFYPVGVVMDRLGRKWVAVPCFLLLSLSLVLVPLSRGFSALLLIGLFAGFANGLGSGINMVLSTDLAPKDSVGEFLGIWRLITDVGMSGGPLMIGFVAQAFSMFMASLFTGGLGLVGALIMVFFVSETLPGAKPAGKPVRPAALDR